MKPWLETDEIDSLCHPLIQKAAQRAYLESLGLHVKKKPDGSPLVLRSNVERVLGGMPVPAEIQGAQQGKVLPNREALVLRFHKKS